MSNYYETGQTPVTNAQGLSIRLHPIQSVDIPLNGFSSICSIRIYDRLNENLDKWVDPDTKQVYDVGSYLSGKTPEGIRVYGPKGKYLGYCPDYAQRLRLRENGYDIGNIREAYERKE